MTRPLRAKAVEQLLTELRPKYLWWKPINGGEHSRDRIVAQIMNLGTYNDIRRLEKALGCTDLARSHGGLLRVGSRPARGNSGEDAWLFPVSESPANRRAGHLMRRRFDPKFEVLPEAQRHIWPSLAAVPRLSFVLYGGTAVALHCGHRQSEDFDFFRHDGVDRVQLSRAFPFMSGSEILEEEPNTVVVSAATPKGPVKVSFFGGLRFGHVRQPMETRDGVLLVASPDDLLVTKLKAILGRAEAKDYADIAELLRTGTSLPTALSAFRKMFGGEPATVLRAIGYFEDGDVNTLAKRDRTLLRKARDSVGDLPVVRISRGSLAGR